MVKRLAHIRFLFLLTMLTLAVISCQTFKGSFISGSAHETYKKELLSSSLADKAMARQWIGQADSALSHPLETSIPQQTIVTYFRDVPIAYAWKMEVKQGRIIYAHISQTDTSQQVFLDLFSVHKNGDIKRLASAKDSILQYQSEKIQTLIIRIQPELLVSGSVVLTLTDKPSMNFPVAGADPADIQSSWGASRDGGARKHEGVDIFATRGTPVRSVAEGRISRTGNRGLGGKQVWLQANGKSIYYAHLDSIIARRLQKVHPGDTLGLVGNTGNAKTTPPHLHFGIYEGRAINPEPFISAARNNPSAVSVNQAVVGKWAHITSAKANIRPLPSTEKLPIASLRKNDVLQLLGAVNNWYLLKLADNRRGFVYQTLVEQATSPLKKQALAAGDSLFYAYSNPALLAQMDSSKIIAIYGYYHRKALGKYHGRWVWVNED